MQVPHIVELIPVLLGLLLVGVLVLVVLMVAASKVRRMLFGRRVVESEAKGLRAFFENFD